LGVLPDSASHNASRYNDAESDELLLFERCDGTVTQVLLV
jgi:hypothetical protein